MQDAKTLRKAFERDGFVHLPGFMNAAEMDEIEQHVIRFLAEVVPKLSKADAMYEDYQRPESLKQVNMPTAGADYFVELRHSEKMLGLAAMLLQEEVEPQSQELFIKPPGMGTPTPPHQDGFYFCIVPSQALTLWLALDDMDDENGTLHYVAASHKKGVLGHKASQVLGFSQGLTEDDLAEFGREVACQMRRGDLLVHHSLTIHRAEGNPSSRLRRALAMVYYAKRAKMDTAARSRYQASVQSQQEEMGVR